MKATQQLHDLGQSLWLDNITREILDNGTLKRYIDDLSVTGLTSNPTIFDHAMTHGNSYDKEIAKLMSSGLSTEDAFFEMAIEDLRRAADLFAPIHQRTATVDGWVSLEVSPLLAYDAKTTVEVAKTLHQKAARPNLFIKIPGTPEGRAAIEEAIFSGVSVNVTLLFSREHYLGAAEAYMRGLERRVEAGLSPDVRSVASLFVSRWDKATMDKVPADLRDKLGPAIGWQRRTKPIAMCWSPIVGNGWPTGRACTTPALRQHGNQRSQGLGRALHRRTGCAQHGRYHAGRNAACLWRARQRYKSLFRAMVATASRHCRHSPKPVSI
jgi:transaldolase